jgi:hypothetical protein
MTRESGKGFTEVLRSSLAQGQFDLFISLVLTQGVNGPNRGRNPSNDAELKK